ncbi:MAG TPA: hypothetical protein VIV58_34955 [Kofleriaceae bacterium]
MEAVRLIALVVLAACGRLEFQSDVVGDAAGVDAACLGTGAFKDIQKIAAASTDDSQTAAFLSPDGLSVIWDQFDGANQRLHIATRSNRAAVFPAGDLIPGMFSAVDYFNASITADGLELYFDSKATVTDCLYRATRTSTAAPFDPPVELPTFCANGDVTGSQISADGLTLVFNSSLDSAGEGDLYITERADRTSEFPAAKKLGGLPTGIGFPALSADRLRLWFEAESGTTLKIVSAVRISPSDVFSQLRDLTEIDTAGDEGDPSLTLDESQLTFVSHRDGTYAAYIATRPCL